MPRKKIIFIFFFCSFFIHALVIFSCSLHIEAKGTPLIHSWLNIIKKGDLFLGKGDFNLPSGTNFPSGRTRRQYFFLPKSTSITYFENKNYEVLDFPLASAFSLRAETSGSEPKDAYFYLWDRSEGFSSHEEESVSYNIYVSSHGKVLLVYPEKLPVNSYGNLYLQEHIRQATFFLNDRFLWTKLEGVVK